MFGKFGKYRQKNLDNWHYRNLFWSIVLLLIFTSFVQTALEGIITSLLLTVTILVMVNNLAITPQWKHCLRGLLAIALGCDLLTLLISSPIISQKLFTLADIVYAVFLGAAIVTISQQLNKAHKVDQNILLGAISVYLLIGILWFLLYRIAYIISPSNFDGLQNDGINNFILLYFSFTTLTTLGYGDITPTDSIAMGLSNMEAIIGQMYSVIFVARLVSLYTTDMNQHPQSSDDSRAD
ncbi:MULTISPECIES: potassium channel family protein [unclassified Synechocystis]|uniref:potassium channel family protein n=1 Tax=unclassified Synechocystis TaxID=2640012 RepID=UPI000407BEF2|nr:MULTISPECIES: potassium channel family protein [unclassified Synechocystis]AIE74715.1 Potassium channel protein [Synechocystis sp. PCC 6714]MCT0253932.1 potassium channel family protein [Synechocystis sp. CS-94]